MGLFLFILISFFLILLILFAMLLLIPIVYSVEAAKEEHYCFDTKISWLGNIIHVQVNKEEHQKMDFFISIIGLHIPLHDRKKVPKRSKKEERKKQERKRTKQELNKYFSFFQRSFLDQAFLLLKKVLRHIMPKKFYLHLIYGFEDPADTGMLTGLFFMLFPNMTNRAIINVDPVFDEERIQGELSMKGRIILAVLIYYFLQFYFAQGVRQTIRKMRNQ